MRNWFRNFILNRVYLNSYKKPVSTRRRYGDTIRTISIILDNNLGIDKDKFNKLCNEFRSDHLWKKTRNGWKLRHSVNLDGTDD